jgi:hypothetical protein
MRAADGGLYAYRTASVKGEHFYGHPEDCLAQWPIDYYTWVSTKDASSSSTGASPAKRPKARRKALPRYARRTTLESWASRLTRYTGSC